MTRLCETGSSNVRFVRDEESGSEGTGLGLAIVRGIIEAHAGRIWLDDPEDGGGAVFAFTLPAVPADVAPPEPAVTDPAKVPAGSRQS